MPKQRRLLAVLLALACALLPGAPPPAAVAAPVAVRIKTGTAQLAPTGVTAGFEPVAENAAFALSADPATLAFELLDKRSGYVWRSNLVEVTKDDKLNKTWTAFAQSGVSIDYLDKVTVPLLLIHAKDDPMVPFGPYMSVDWDALPTTRLILTDHGGHVGFHSRGSAPYYVGVAVDFLQEAVG